MQVMPNITIDKLERFVQALIESRGRQACQVTSQLADFARHEVWASSCTAA